MSICHRLAAYVNRASEEQISPEAKGKLKQHMLDSLGCALGAIPNDTMAAIRSEALDNATTGSCSLIGGGRTTPESAAFYNTALVSTLPFRDVFMAGTEVAHPADNLPTLLAAAEMTGASGSTLMLALLLGYHVQCRLVASGGTHNHKGIDSSVALCISLAAGLSKILKLSEIQTAHAIALCAAESITLLAGKAGSRLAAGSALANASAAARCMKNVRLARAGVEGPLHIFEAPSGLQELLGSKFEVDWDHEGTDAILACSLLRFSTDIYAQSALQAVLELRAEHQIDPLEVQGMHVDLFRAGYDALGGAQSHRAGSKESMEEAAQSLPYLLALALLDAEVYPGQFHNERWKSPAVESLAQRTVCWLSLAYTKEYPAKLKCKVRIGMKDGQIFETERDSFDGYFRSPMSVDALLLKFKRLGSLAGSDAQLQRLIECVARSEQLQASELARALEAVGQARDNADSSGRIETLKKVQGQAVAVA